MKVQANFEKAYWQLEPTLFDDKKELAAATLRPIALNYIEQKSPRLPKALVRSINQLKKRDDIVISKPDKGSGVWPFVLCQIWLRSLLSEPSINDETKFKPVYLERPSTRERPEKHYHPLQEKEKRRDFVFRRILSKHIADTVCQKGSRLAHLYGLPKTHKEQLAIRPVLSATGTYKYALAKWLDENRNRCQLATTPASKSGYQTSTFQIQRQSFWTNWWCSDEFPPRATHGEHVCVLSRRS